MHTIELSIQIHNILLTIPREPVEDNKNMNLNLTIPHYLPKYHNNIDSALKHSKQGISEQLYNIYATILY